MDQHDDDPRWVDVLAVILIVMAIGAIAVTVVVISGCSTTPTVNAPRLPDVEHGSDPSGSLRWLAACGGLMTLTSAVLLFISRGTRGWITLLLGVGLLMTAYWLAAYVDQMIWLAIPTVAGIVGLSGYQAWKAIKIKRNGGSSGPPSPLKRKGMTL